MQGQGIMLEISTTKGIITGVKRERVPWWADREQSLLSDGQVMRRCNELMDSGVLMSAYTAMITCNGDLLKKYIHDIVQGL